MLAKSRFLMSLQLNKGLSKFKFGVQRSGNIVNPKLRKVHTTSLNCALPSAVIVFLSKFSKVGSAVVGRSFRWWWNRLPAEEKQQIVQRIKRKRLLEVSILLSAILGCAYYYKHIEEAPITGRRRFVAFTDEEYDEISFSMFASLLVANESHIISPSDGNEQYKVVTTVAERLLNANRDLDAVQSKCWTTTVIQDDFEQNAFVLPCGKIFVYTGILNICENEDQLAIILGHELAHSILGHGKESGSFLHLVDLFMMIPFAFLWALIPSDITAAALHWVTEQFTATLLSLPHSRFQESEADAVGLQLAAKACFDIREAPVLWARMNSCYADAEENATDWGLAKWLSTHPPNEVRQEQLSQLIPNALGIMEECSCPLLPRKDPREKIALLSIFPVEIQHRDIEDLCVRLEVKSDDPDPDPIENTGFSLLEIVHSFWNRSIRGS